MMKENTKDIILFSVIGLLVVACGFLGWQVYKLQSLQLDIEALYKFEYYQGTDSKEYRDYLTTRYNKPDTNRLVSLPGGKDIKVYSISSDWASEIRDLQADVEDLKADSSSKILDDSGISDIKDKVERLTEAVNEITDYINSIGSANGYLYRN
jgi:hypothetical protein